MKKAINKIFFLLLGLCVVCTACKDDTEEQGPLSRLFSPVEFDNVVALPDGVSLSWSEVTGASSYKIELAADSSFSEILRTVDNLKETRCEITDLGFKVKYVARVFAVSETVNPSKPQLSKAFTTLSRVVPEVLYAVDRNDVTIMSALIRWNVEMLAENPMDQLVYKQTGTGVTDTEEHIITLSAQEAVAGEYLLSGLTPGMSYELKARNSAIEGEKGDYNIVTFRTKDDALPTDRIYVEGEDIDNVLAEVSDGGTIFIPAGVTVTCTASGGSPTNFVINKSITFRGGSSATGEKATISFKEMRISGNLATVRFENLLISAASGGQYCVNLKDDTGVFEGLEALEFVDCEITGYSNSIIRHQGTEKTGIQKILIDNCLVHDMNPSGSSYALFMFKNAEYFVTNYEFKNSTFYNIGTNIIENRLTAASAYTCTAAITNCTFYNIGGNNRQIFDFDNSKAGSITFENVIMSKIMDPTACKGIRANNMTPDYRNTYKTSDVTFASGKFDAEALTMSGDELFPNASAGDFSLKAGSGLTNVGDPRW